jgi:hypothetical protein
LGAASHLLAKGTATTRIARHNCPCRQCRTRVLHPSVAVVIGYLREAGWALVPVKGPEAGSVPALPLLLEWLEEANGARLLGFVPTMYKPRRGDSRQWLPELERLAAKAGTRVFPPIGDMASLASFRMDAHPYAPLAAAVEEVLVGALV